MSWIKNSGIREYKVEDYWKEINAENQDQQDRCLIQQAVDEAIKSGKKGPFTFLISCPCKRCTPYSMVV